MIEYIELVERTARSNYETTIKMYGSKETKESSIMLAKRIVSTLRNGGKVMVAGNGGSAADAHHFVADLVSKYLIERKPLRAIALTTDSSVITSIGNDYGYEQVFRRQIEALGDKGDLFLGITTSGKSANILEALEESGRRGFKQVACAANRINHVNVM